jgi:type III secretion protein C
MTMKITLCFPALFRAAVLFSVALSTAHPAPLPWRHGPYAYYAENAPVSKVIQEFCTTIGIQAQIDPGISGRVNGKLSAPSGPEFLDLFISNYGLSWYYHGGILYVSKKTQDITRTFPVAAGAIAGLKQALADLGVLDGRFGWAEIPQQGMVIVSGPPEYVRIVAQTIETLPLSRNGQQVLVFRLKYASVEDRTIFYRDRQRTVVGMATILKSLINTTEQRTAPRLVTGEQIRPAKAMTALPDSSLDSLSEPLPPPRPDRRDSGIDAPAFSTDPGSDFTNQNRRDGTARPAFEAGINASIEADTRLNAIIIKDTPDRFPMYEKLIASLDVPAPMIEIEARIIDVNKNKMRELGFDWGVAAKNASFAFGGPATPPAPSGLSDFALGINARVTSNTVVLNGGSYLLSRIRALESLGDANTVARPSILTTDNLGALIDMSQTFYAQVSGERVANLVPVTVGTMLKVTPHVIEQDGERYIQMVVDIEDGTLISREGVGLPVVQKSTLATQAVILENQSLLIGGYNTESVENKQTRIPIFSDLPVLGRLFTANWASRKDQERLFLITPHIVDPLALAKASLGPAAKRQPPGNYRKRDVAAATSPESTGLRLDYTMNSKLVALHLDRSATFGARAVP